MNIVILERNAKKTEHYEKVSLADLAFIWTYDDRLMVLKSRYDFEHGGYEKGTLITPNEMLTGIRIWHNYEVRLEEAEKLLESMGIE